MAKIKKLKIKLLRPEKELRRRYEKAKAEFIVSFGYEFTFFGKRTRPDIGEAKWNKSYPEGFSDWAEKNQYVLTSYGQQDVVDKIDEIIDKLNKDK